MDSFRIHALWNEKELFTQQILLISTSFRATERCLAFIWNDVEAAETVVLPPFSAEDEFDYSWVIMSDPGLESGDSLPAIIPSERFMLFRPSRSFKYSSIYFCRHSPIRV